ncbi:MAG: hypothetical protein NVS4B3_27430 [Gemmatimonadaceae bacterium]
MKGPRFQALIICPLLAALGAPYTPLHAQSRVVPAADAPHLMVLTFRSPDKTSGVQAADELRADATRSIGGRNLYVVPRNDIFKNLEAAGYSTSEGLTDNDAKELAKILRADEIVVGSVTKTPSGYRVESRLVLARDPALGQPLGAYDVGKPGDAAGRIVRALADARKQLDGNRKCENALRAGDTKTATAEANRAIAAYPNATLARLCLATAYRQMKAPSDSVLRLTSEIVRIDPKSRLALAFASEEYQKMAAVPGLSEARKDSLDDRYVQTLFALYNADPSNTGVAEEIAKGLARSGHPERAKGIIEQILKDNPGDPRFERLYYSVLLANKEWKHAAAAGEEMVKSDTSLADTTFFIRQVAAYTSDSQPQLAAQVAAKGTQKFPTNAGLLLVYGQTLRSAGQLDMALTAYTRAAALDPKSSLPYLQAARIYQEKNRADSAVVYYNKAIAADPKNAGAYQLLARYQAEQGRSDDIVSTLKAAEAAGIDKSTVGQSALAAGNALYKQANGEQDPGKKRASLQKAQTVLAYSDKLAPTPNAKLLLGISSASIALGAMQDANKGKSCELARLAQEEFTTAQINLPAGAQASKDAAEQYLKYVAQYAPIAEKQVKAYCGRGTRGQRGS